MATTELSFPPVIDSSMRGEFVSCPQSFNWRYLRRLQRRGRSIHLHFGAAFAAGVEAFRVAFYEIGQNTDTALMHGAAAIVEHWGDYGPSPEGSAKTLEGCIAALEAYVAQYPPATDHIRPAIDHDGHVMTEFSFAIPLPIAHPETGEPILYSGRFDMIARMGNILVGLDDKTTSQLGAQWSHQWRLRAQFTGYCWGARQYGFELESFVVRGISILKRGFGHAEVIEQRPQWMVDRWETQLHRDIHRMIHSWRTGEWDLALDSACSSYGGCQFLDLCTSHDPERWLEDYETTSYDPLAAPERRYAPPEGVA
jgi:PD-(D/E)XK nuclease superfamily